MRDFESKEEIDRRLRQLDANPDDLGNDQPEVVPNYPEQGKTFLEAAVEAIRAKNQSE